jgi:hypothetical protein
VHCERFPFLQLELIPFQFGANSIHKRSHLQRKKSNSNWRPLWNRYVSDWADQEQILMGHKPAVVQVLHGSDLEKTAPIKRAERIRQKI